MHGEALQANPLHTAAAAGVAALLHCGVCTAASSAAWLLFLPLTVGTDMRAGGLTNHSTCHAAPRRAATSASSWSGVKGADAHTLWCSMLAASE
jgi:hypothetical protein